MHRHASRRLATAAARLLAAALVCAACRNVALAPTDPSWREGEVPGESRWRSGDVEVAATLVARYGEFPVRGLIVNHGGAAVHATFRPRTSFGREVVLGTTRPYDPEAARTLRAGESVDVPPGTEAAPGTLRFALRADSPWTQAWPPAEGATASFDLALATASGELSCPFTFRVSEVGGAATDSVPGRIVLGIAAIVGILAFVVFLVFSA